MKKCSVCKKLKKLNEFHSRSDSPDGYRNNCKECRRLKLKINRTEIFISKAIKIHGDKYGYTKVKFKNSHFKVLITCSKHGDFLQLPHNHLQGKGCKKCVDEGKKKNKKNKDKEKKTEYALAKEKLSKCIEVHGSRYLYEDNFKFYDKKKIKIICRVHGEFKQDYYSHLSGRGCRKCGIIKLKRTKTKYTKELKKLSTVIRARMYKYIRKKGLMKTKRTIEILGCDFKFLISYLNNNPYNFKVGDKGIEIDHIKPLSSASTSEEMFKLFRYDNLQLVTKHYNRNIKRAKNYDELHFKEWYEKNIIKNNGEY